MKMGVKSKKKGNYFSKYLAKILKSTFIGEILEHLRAKIGSVNKDYEYWPITLEKIDNMGLHLLFVEVGLRPHGLRATFITLALEGEAPLEKVQFAAGPARPGTTLRYQKRKLNLDDNAVDYLHDMQA